MIKIFKNVFIIFASLVAVSLFTNSYYQDSVSVSGNTFQAGVWVEPVINEIYFNSNTGEIEWIEILNNRPTALSLSGYTIEDNTASSKNLSSYSISANDYLVLYEGIDFTFGLNNDGDILKLKKTGSIIDQVSYGNCDDGNLIDNALAPGKGQSIARIPNGKDTNIDKNDFQIDNSPTPGALNSL